MHKPDPHHDDDLPAADGWSERRTGSSRARLPFAWRPNVWLTTISTVVAAATGMFTLRTQVFPNDDTATASIGRYQHSVGAICDALNDAEKARTRDARRLGRQLPKGAPHARAARPAARHVEQVDHEIRASAWSLRGA